jgi:hypothetical protein
MPVDWQIDWIDRGREPQCAPNPKYPRGVDIDSSDGAEKTCASALPYPAKRCGYFVVKCRTCGMTAMVTTAGRPDDPRSLRLACKR